MKDKVSTCELSLEATGSPLIPDNLLLWTCFCNVQSSLAPNLSFSFQEETELRLVKASEPALGIEAREMNTQFLGTVSPGLFAG